MIRSQNQIKIESGTSSMSDLVFLLLIFFVLTSSLVNPNALDLMLPQSENKIAAKDNVSITIKDLDEKDENGLSRCEIRVGETEISSTTRDAQVEELQDVIAQEMTVKAEGDKEAGVFVSADQSTDVQYIVNIIDAVNRINKANDTRYKVVLGTQQPQK